MTNILTSTQAINVLRVASGDARVTDLLPQIDKFIERATGRDWTQDATIHPVAVSAATMLLVMWFENPGMIGDASSMSFGMGNALVILEAEALKYRKVQFYGASGIGGISIAGAQVGDDVIKLVGISGVSGTQTSKFESEISVDGQIQQIAAEDLSENLYIVVLKAPTEDIGV